jgi:hypothetical protein
MHDDGLSKLSRPIDYLTPMRIKRADKMQENNSRFQLPSLIAAGNSSEQGDIKNIHNNNQLRNNKRNLRSPPHPEQNQFSSDNGVNSTGGILDNMRL